MQGKQLSYNNINDTDAAYECVAEFDPNRTAAVVIVKHANPCGVAEGETLLEAYDKALRCDPVSAFGGIVALNRPLDADAARKIVEIFTEVIIAPVASEEAVAIVGAKKNLRLLLAGALPDPRQPGFGAANGLGRIPGAGARQRHRRRHGPEGRHAARATRTGRWRTCRFAFRVAKHVKSNAIVYAKDGATVGIGAGQMSRVDSSRIAAWKAAEAAKAAGLGDSLAKGVGRGVGRLFPLRGRPPRGGRGRRDGRDPARRLDARRRGDQRRRRGRARNGVHGPPALPALSGAPTSGRTNR